MIEDYKGYTINLNNWDEFCVIKKNDVGMVSYNSGFSDLKTAKKMVDWLIKNPDVSQRQIEQQANFFKPISLR